MKYPKEYLQEIKTRLKVSTVVSKTVNLKKRGKEYVGLSPFKTEKTPSFTVNDEKEFYHCFSTAEHGNIFDFVMKTQNLKFGESVKYLANLAGMRPYTFSKEDEIREEKWNKYKLIYAKYVEFYHEDLLKNPEAKEAKNYLKNRRIYEILYVLILQLLLPLDLIYLAYLHLLQINSEKGFDLFLFLRQ